MKYSRKRKSNQDRIVFLLRYNRYASEEFKKWVEKLGIQPLYRCTNDRRRIENEKTCWCETIKVTEDDFNFLKLSSGMYFVKWRKRDNYWQPKCKDDSVKGYKVVV